MQSFYCFNWSILAYDVEGDFYLLPEFASFWFWGCCEPGSLGQNQSGWVRFEFSPGYNNCWFYRWLPALNNVWFLPVGNWKCFNTSKNATCGWNCEKMFSSGTQGFFIHVGGTPWQLPSKTPRLELMTSVVAPLLPDQPYQTITAQTVHYPRSADLYLDAYLTSQVAFRPSLHITPKYKKMLPAC